MTREIIAGFIGTPTKPITMNATTLVIRLSAKTAKIARVAANTISPLTRIGIMCRSAKRPTIELPITLAVP